VAIETNIEWSDSTVNPTTGCEGCELWNGKDERSCYAGNLHEVRLAKSFPALYDEDFQVVRHAPGRMKKAAAWPDLRGKERPEKPWLDGKPRHIFVGDMGDFCSRSVSDDYIRSEILDVIDSPDGGRHFWLLLTKQIKRLAEISEKVGGLPDNCMAMTSVTGQSFADLRIPWLLKTRCKWRGVSGEPLLGPIDLAKWTDACGYYCDHQPDPEDGIYYGYGHRPDRSKINWIIVGGASGPHARPMHPDWARSLRDQCQAAGVPFFFKQWGDWLSPQPEHVERHGARFFLRVQRSAIEPRGLVGKDIPDSANNIAIMYRVGKKKAGAMLDGREWHGISANVKE
jgi:protein gp37